MVAGVECTSEMSLKLYHLTECTSVGPLMQW